MGGGNLSNFPKLTFDKSGRAMASWPPVWIDPSSKIEYAHDRRKIFEFKLYQFIGCLKCQGLAGLIQATFSAVQRLNIKVDYYSYKRNIS